MIIFCIAIQGSQAHLDERLSLIGNSWSVPVVSWILSQLGSVAGLNVQMSVQEVVQRTAPGCTKVCQTFLQRPLMEKVRKAPAAGCEETLVHKLLTMGGPKGEDFN